MKEKPEQCEGCDRAPATTYDSEGIPLCEKCAELPSDIVESLANNRGHESARRSSSELACSEWMDALAQRLERRADNMGDHNAFPFTDYKTTRHALRILIEEIRACGVSASIGELTRGAN